MAEDVQSISASSSNNKPMTSEIMNVLQRFDDLKQLKSPITLLEKIKEKNQKIKLDPVEIKQIEADEIKTKDGTFGHQQLTDATAEAQSILSIGDDHNKWKRDLLDRPPKPAPSKRKRPTPLLPSEEDSQERNEKKNDISLEDFLFGNQKSKPASGKKVRRTENDLELDIIPHCSKASSSSSNFIPPSLTNLSSAPSSVLTRDLLSVARDLVNLTKKIEAGEKIVDEDISRKISFSKN